VGSDDDDDRAYSVHRRAPTARPSARRPAVAPGATLLGGPVPAPTRPLDPRAEPAPEPVAPPAPVAPPSASPPPPAGPSTITLEAFHKLLAAGTHHGASDIHFRVGDPPTYRVHGALSPLKFDKLKSADTRAICQLVLRDPAVLADLDQLQEHDASYSLPGVSRFRVNIFRQRGSLSLILRIIPSKIPTIADLGLPDAIREIAGFERGLVLVTGATGSGKSSTLAAMISQINHDRRCHILTIEDPIEFLHANAKASVSQREIGIDTRNFNIALRAALRQDPDVILVGEMRDAETVDIALKASETGHMVFSTVHTTDASKTVGRLLGVFPSEEQQAVRYRLADNLKATISQRLLPRLDGKGRAVACEIMIVNKTLQEYLRDPTKTGNLKDVIEKSRTGSGMQSFDQHLAELMKKGVVSRETALQAATNPADLERALQFE
jgi:twitching motility protein PilT